MDEDIYVCKVCGPGFACYTKGLSLGQYKCRRHVNPSPTPVWVKCNPEDIPNHFYDDAY